MSDDSDIPKTAAAPTPPLDGAPRVRPYRPGHVYAQFAIWLAGLVMLASVVGAGLACVRLGLLKQVTFQVSPPRNGTSVLFGSRPSCTSTRWSALRARSSL
jgi:hypothetical protein